MPLNIVAYAYGGAANNPDCARGPGVIQNSSILKSRNLPVKWVDLLQTRSTERGLQAQKTVAELNQKLASDTCLLVKEGQRFLTLGGDHSSAIGTWSGAAAALDQPLGLLWIDAHLDSHTPQTSHSQNIHGMPLAVLLGYGENELTQIQGKKPKISPENLVILGARNFEEGEHALLERLGVPIFYMPEIQRLGLDAVMKKATKIITEKTGAFGFSLDLDGLDPRDAPAVGYREPEGIRSAELFPHLQLLAQNPHFIGAEIAEFNPLRDEDQKTEQLIVDLIQILC